MREDKKLCAQAEEAQTLAAQLDSDVDFLAWELRPAALDDLGLTMALHNYVREWSGHFNTPAEFHASNLEAARLAPEIETNLYRIAQEALNNIYKYAGASRVEVLLERRDHHVVLIVEDDGIGFDLHKKENTDPTVKGNGDRGLASWVCANAPRSSAARSRSNPTSARAQPSSRAFPFHLPLINHRGHGCSQRMYNNRISGAIVDAWMRLHSVKTASNALCFNLCVLRALCG